MYQPVKPNNISKMPRKGVKYLLRICVIDISNCILVMDKIYTPFLVAFLAFVIIGFSFYKQLMRADEQEGLENMDSQTIVRSDGKSVKRRKRSATIDEPVLENYKEGIKIAGISAIQKNMKNIPKMTSQKVIKPMTKSFTKVGKQISGGFTKIFGIITKFFKYVGDVFVSIFSYIECGFYKVIKLPQCMGWYMLEVFGHILYIPFGFFFWVFSLQAIEKQIWGVLEDVDCFCHASTGYHLIHYSDSIINKCYKCNIKKMPKFPKI